MTESRFDVVVVGNNGAGDGLAVGFLSSYVLGDYDLRDSALRGQIAARFTCTQKATSSSLITADRLDYYFDIIDKGARRGQQVGLVGQRRLDAGYRSL